MRYIFLAFILAINVNVFARTGGRMPVHPMYQGMSESAKSQRFQGELKELIDQVISSAESGIEDRLNSQKVLIEIEVQTYSKMDAYFAETFYGKGATIIEASEQKAVIQVESTLAGAIFLSTQSSNRLIRLIEKR